MTPPELRQWERRYAKRAAATLGLRVPASFSRFSKKSSLIGIDGGRRRLRT
jgi:hypothetical protein